MIKRNPKLAEGEILLHHNGLNYRVVKDNGDGTYRLARVLTEAETAITGGQTWNLTAHGLCIYSDGEVVWDYSTDGCWA